MDPSGAIALAHILISQRQQICNSTSMVLNLVPPVLIVRYSSEIADCFDERGSVVSVLGSFNCLRSLAHEFLTQASQPVIQKPANVMPAANSGVQRKSQYGTLKRQHQGGIDWIVLN